MKNKIFITIVLLAIMSFISTPSLQGFSLESPLEAISQWGGGTSHFLQSMNLYEIDTGNADILSASTPNSELLTPNSQKSALNAMLMSAVLPGTGQLYLGNSKRATVYLSADVLAFFALYRTNMEKNNLTDSFKIYAYSNAGLRRGASDDIYRLAQRFMTSDEYNKSVERYARNFLLANRITQEEYDEYVERFRIRPEDSWDWQNEHYFREYRAIRQDRQTFEIYENFALGALLINRIISVIDAAFLTNKVNRNSQVYAVPENNGRGISLIYEYHF